jgi:transcription termination/antitermination protein NusA
LSPAKISRVTVLDPVEKHMEVIVDDSQLSLAIGKKGQNVRLAAKLLGWRIDIKSEEEKRQEVESAMAALVAPGAPLSVLVDYGMSDKLIERLLEAGVATVEKLGSMTPEELEEIQGIGPKMVERIQIAVNNYFNQLEGIPPVSEALAEGESLAQSAAETAAEPALEDAGAAGFETSIITPGEEEWAAEQPAETELSVEEEQPAEVTAQPVADTEPSMEEDAEQLVESTAEPLMDEEALSPDGEEFPGLPPEDQEQASETYGAEPEAAKPVAENSDSASLESDRMNDKGSGSHDREQENDEEGG